MAARGVRWTTAVDGGDGVQQDIKGYDPDHYMDMALVLPGQDISNETARRSYAALYITKQVNKLINVCLIKDHQSAGVTVALKNLSHGLVNNVARSHATKSLNACGAFIPASVSIPMIRNKAVLHICDGIKGVYHGGPFARPEFVWEHKSMYFSTDPSRSTTSAGRSSTPSAPRWVRSRWPTTCPTSSAPSSASSPSTSRFAGRWGSVCGSAAK